MAKNYREVSQTAFFPAQNGKSTYMFWCRFGVYEVSADATVALFESLAPCHKVPSSQNGDLEKIFGAGLSVSAVPLILWPLLLFEIRCLVLGFTSKRAQRVSRVYCIQQLIKVGGKAIFFVEAFNDFDGAGNTVVKVNELRRFVYALHKCVKTKLVDGHESFEDRVGMMVVGREAKSRIRILGPGRELRSCDGGRSSGTITVVTMNLLLTEMMVHFAYNSRISRMTLTDIFVSLAK